jgi:hypothetical protein
MSGAARFFTETAPEHWLLVALETVVAPLVVLEDIEVIAEVIVLGPAVEEPERNE